LILYKLNPSDFEAAYRDAVVLPQAKWRSLLDFAYGTTEYSGTGGAKHEFDDYGAEDDYEGNPNDE